MKCWYCHIERTLGDGHMYECVTKRVRRDNINRAMVDAMNCDLTTPCPVPQCGVKFKGKFSEIVVKSVIHFEKYHKEEL